MDEYVVDASVTVSLVFRDEPFRDKAFVFFQAFR